VELLSFTVDGKMVAVNTTSVKEGSGSRGARTAKSAVAVGAIGAIIGAIAAAGRGRRSEQAGARRRAQVRKCL
jgi:hypothetical protein